MVSHLLNVEKALAETVAKALRLKTIPKPAEPARPPRTDLEAVRSLSILLNAHDSFEGRKLGVLISDGVDVGVLKALRQALNKESATLELVAPEIGGAEASDGSWIEANQTISGGPSVLYDAIAVLVSDEAIPQLIKDPAARDFVVDAYAHSKFIAYTSRLRKNRKFSTRSDDIVE